MVKTIENENDMPTAGTQYKQGFKQNLIKYKRRCKSKIANMRTKDPTSYWNYINSINKKTTSNTADMHILFDLFKDLNAEKDYGNEGIEADFPDINIEHNLNAEITEDEISKAIKCLKNGKATGLDNISNEYLKHSVTLLLPLLTKMFNLVLNSGIIPESWKIGSIIPIYKNKGDIKSPENYRPITLLSCIGKLFTAILNKRLTDFIESNSLMNCNQAGL